MASYDFDPKTQRARFFFRCAGRQYNKTLPVRSDREADRLRALIEETVTDLDRGKFSMPPDADPVAFLISGGRVTGPPAPSPAIDSLTLARLFELYRADPPPHLEGSTRKMQEIHCRRLLEVFPSIEVGQFDKAAAQGYIARRSKQKYRGKPIQRETIGKELTTLRQAWAWVADRRPGTPPPTFRLKDLSFPKARIKHPFMTWEQIEREIARGGLRDEEVAELWDSLWLDKQQVRDCLEHVRRAATPPFLYPMFCFAAYTGARRSELCRSRLGDWRLDEGIVKLRQKKRDKDKSFTYRDVPIHPALANVMRPWIGAHPGGQYTVCQADGSPVTWNAAAHRFRFVLGGSKWSVVRGWHVLRHSFASNLAAAGVDQRKIDRWMGHSTEIRWRYQHVQPEDQLDAVGVL